ncbi:hypothetical protein RCL1_007349 [Eukaryota sp. TZLM3-RCL]
MWEVYHIAITAMSNKIFDFIFVNTSVPSYQMRLPISLVGDISVGKTTLVSAFVNGVRSLDLHYKATIGASVFSKDISINNEDINLVIFDVSGEERFKKSVSKVYYQGAQAAIICFDLTRETTLQGAVKWRQSILDYTKPNSNPIPILLVGTKSDLVEQRIPDEVIQTIRREFNFTEYIETSAKYNINVHETFIRATQLSTTNHSTFQQDGVVVHSVALSDINCSC